MAVAPIRMSMSPIRFPSSRSLALSTPKTRHAASSSGTTRFQEQPQGLSIGIKVSGSGQTLVEFGEGDDT